MSATIAKKPSAPAEFTSQGDLKSLLIELLPEQGCWSEEEYLWLTDHTNRLVEFTDGYLEVLPMPTDKHQTVLGYLYLIFTAFIKPLGGKVHFAGIRLRIRANKYREPDLILVRSAKDSKRDNLFWKGADLTLEVVSKDKPERDLVDKVKDYAEAGIPEYWIVNPFNETITVFKLQDKAYVEHGVFGRGTTATSVLLEGFTVNVDAVMDEE